MTIKCLIIDDEPSAQIILKNFIEKVDFLELCGTCNNAITAIERLQTLDIDLLFLDIKMPKISGLTFFKSLQTPPKVIFTTAYPKYAVDGFNVNALDFLLKPFSFERFLTACNKVIENQGTAPYKTTSNNSILLKANKTIHKVLLKNLLLIEAYGDYVKVYTTNKLIITNKTFSSTLGLLPKSNFIQVHKSYAINLDAISSLSGNQITINDHHIPIGLKYKSDFLKFFNESHL